MHRKIAKLPKPLRDLINSMLDDAAPAREIIAKLQESADPPLPYPISEQNISDWKNGGYQDYLRQQDWRADSRFLLESGSDITELSNGPQLQQTLIQLALIEIFRALKAGTVQADSPNYIRLFNALARLNREALGLRKYADLQAKAQTSNVPASDPRSNLEQKRALTMEMMQVVLGCPASPGPIGPDLSALNLNPTPAPVGMNSTSSPESLQPSTINPPPSTDRSSRGDEAPSSTPSGRSRRGREADVLESALASPAQTVPAADNPTPPEHALTPEPKIENQDSKTDARDETPSTEPAPAAKVPSHGAADEVPVKNESDSGLEEMGAEQSKIEIQKSKIDCCPFCDAKLPPLLPTGERPLTHCNTCGNYLPPPEPVNPERASPAALAA